MVTNIIILTNIIPITLIISISPVINTLVILGYNNPIPIGIGIVETELPPKEPNIKLRIEVELVLTGLLIIDVGISNWNSIQNKVDDMKPRRAPKVFSPDAATFKPANNPVVTPITIMLVNAPIPNAHVVVGYIK